MSGQPNDQMSDQANNQMSDQVNDQMTDQAKGQITDQVKDQPNPRPSYTQDDSMACAYTFWNFIESQMGTTIPKYLQNILRLCGFDNAQSIKTLTGQDFKDLEQFAKATMHKYIPIGANLEEYYHIFSKQIQEFEILAGHVRLLEEVVKSINAMIASKGPTFFDIKSKQNLIRRGYFRGGDLHKIPMIVHRKTSEGSSERATTSTIARSEEIQSSEISPSKKKFSQTSYPDQLQNILKSGPAIVSADEKNRLLTKISKWIRDHIPVLFNQIKDIKWTTKPTTVNNCIDPLPAWNYGNIDAMLKTMELKNATCPVMAVRVPFSEKFVDKSRGKVQSLVSDDGDSNKANLFMISLFDVNNKKLSLDDLRQKAEGIALAYTQEEITYIEDKTKEQSKCLLWYRFRTGRVTGSVFKSVCRTSIKTPAISLIERICYPEQHIFHSKQTEYGKRNEANAYEDYAREMEFLHSNFYITRSGLVVNNDFPHCGVSPDGIAYCDCCGKGTLEIKCPYLLRFNKLRAYLEKKDCPLVIVDGEYELRKGHEYYYQVQMQIVLLNVDFCDFVIWYPQNFITVRVLKDEKFWNQEYPKTESFFKKVLLPELLGCYFTRNKRSITIK